MLAVPLTYPDFVVVIVTVANVPVRTPVTVTSPFVVSRYADVKPIGTDVAAHV